ncbi:MAG: family 10 glycosylhydrolase [Lentisphaeria bacterium]|nr:family 10 glycosylhydrolase [Lentisphaeria bacterium]
MKKIFQLFPAILFLLTLLPLQAAPEYTYLKDPDTGRRVKYSALPNDKRAVFLPTRYFRKQSEFRGIWVATYAGIDFPKTSSPQHFCKVYRQYLANIRNAGFTAVIFQIRPSCDAFYNSKINPFSRSIRGQEGVGYPQFDMLKYMIAETRRHGLEFHAWLNPYRVAGSTTLSKNAYLKTLSPMNFARKNPSAVLESPTANGRMLILDPGNPLVKNHLLATVQEIITRYAPDAIHFDDYFYPYDYKGNNDLATYRKYNKDPGITIDAWRRNNVNQMIRSVSTLIRQNNKVQKKKIRFGISPFGIWLNSKTTPYGSLTLGNESYFSNYSDSRQWIKRNWIDYIIPQLYWSFNHPKAPYAALADWWANTVTGTSVKLYIGIGAYQKLSTKNTAELKNQILYNCRRQEIRGCAIYSYSKVFAPENLFRYNLVYQVINGCWKYRLYMPPALQKQNRNNRKK